MSLLLTIKNIPLVSKAPIMIEALHFDDVDIKSPHLVDDAWREISERLIPRLKEEGETMIGSSKRALRRTAILAAAGAAVAVWILMLGVTARHVSPIPVSVAETTVAPAAKPVAKPPVVPDAATAKPAAEPAPAKPRAHRVVSRLAPARNPEEDVVAKDFVIRYNRRSPQTRTQAKKISPGVKYYSDLH